MSDAQMPESCCAKRERIIAKLRQRLAAVAIQRDLARAALKRVVKVIKTGPKGLSE